MAAAGTADHYARTPAGAASAGQQVFDQSVGPQSSASASSPAPATILMLVKDAANGAADSTENGTSTPPRSAPRSTKHDSGTFTVCFSRGIHFAIAGALSKSAPPIDSVTAAVGACTGTMSNCSAPPALANALRLLRVELRENSRAGARQVTCLASCWLLTCTVRPRTAGLSRGHPRAELSSETRAIQADGVGRS